MGSEISSLVVEPMMGIVIITLSVYAIIKENENDKTSAKWFAIGSVSLTIALIIAGIVLAMLA